MSEQQRKDRVKVSISDYYRQTPDFHILMHQIIECHRCTARDECRAPVPPAGNPRGQIMLLGRNPGHTEDKDGIPFVGQGGILLQNWIEWAQLPQSQLYITNMVKCYTNKDRKPEITEIAACTHWFQEELKYVQPRLIITFGEQATTFVIGFWAHARLNVHIRHFAGDNFYVIPAIHPGAPLHQPRMMKEFKDDAFYTKAMIRNHPALMASLTT